MSKIAIISQPDQGVLIDVSGCSTLREAIDHLSSTLQVSSQFWKGTNIALNLGQLELNTTQIAQVLAITKGVGAFPKQVFTKNGITRTALRDNGVTIGSGEPMGLPEIDIDNLTEHEVTQDEVTDAIPAEEVRSALLYEHDTVDVEGEVQSAFESEQTESDPLSEAVIDTPRARACPNPSHTCCFVPASKSALWTNCQP